MALCQSEWVGGESTSWPEQWAQEGLRTLFSVSLSGL